MKNAEFKDIASMLDRLFWWVPENDRESLSPDAIVEAVLSHGDAEMVGALFDCYGLEKVAAIFRRQTSGRRVNYRPRTLHFFNAYFRRHLPDYEGNHVQKHSDARST